jgi:PAS domain S-box-containing protein
MFDAWRKSNARLAILTNAMPQMVWSPLADGFHEYYHPYDKGRWCAFAGVPPASTDGDGWNGMFHPEDPYRASTRWRHGLVGGAPYEIEYRLRHHSGDYRWILGRALPVCDAGGKTSRWTGTCTDIEEQKRTSAQNEILNRELSHCIKNIFAVIGGLIGLSARRDSAVKPFAQDLRARVSGLGRAHECVRPHSEEVRPIFADVTLKTMLHDLLSADPAHAEALERHGRAGSRPDLQPALARSPLDPQDRGPRQPSRPLHPSGH